MIFPTNYQSIHSSLESTVPDQVVSTASSALATVATLQCLYSSAAVSLRVLSSASAPRSASGAMGSKRTGCRPRPLAILT
jgi:hypothetical protein